MKKVKLLSRIDQETGELGLMVEGTPIINYPMVATDGLLIAHDLLEHVNGVEAIGSIGDELLAMGAVWFVRGEWCDLNRNRPNIHSAEENIASDLINMGRIVLEGEVPYRVPVPRTRLHDQDESFRDIINYSYEGLEHELYNFNNKRVNAYLQDCLHFMRRGYNLAKKKHDQRAVNSLFWLIAEEVNENLKYVELEGQSFTLTYDENRLYVNMEESCE